MTLLFGITGLHDVFAALLTCSRGSDVLDLLPFFTFCGKLVTYYHNWECEAQERNHIRGTFWLPF